MVLRDSGIGPGYAQGTDTAMLKTGYALRYNDDPEDCNFCGLLHA